MNFMDKFVRIDLVIMRLDEIFAAQSGLRGFDAPLR